MEINGRECTIYAILNIETQERYVGSTVNFKNRKKSHWSDLRLKKHGSWKMQRAYTHYGEEKFRFIILETFFADTPEEVYVKEQFWIDLYKPEYNINMIAGSFIPTSARTKEARRKQSNKVTGRKQPQEEKDRRAQSLRDHWAKPEFKGTKKISEGQKKRLSEINTGENNPNWGLKRTPEQLENLSKGRANIKHTFRSPTGELVEIVNPYKNSMSLTGLSFSSIRNLYGGKLTQCQGWTFVKSEKIK